MPLASLFGEAGGVIRDVRSRRFNEDGLNASGRTGGNAGSSGRDRRTDVHAVVRWRLDLKLNAPAAQRAFNEVSETGVDGDSPSASNRRTFPPDVRHVIWPPRVL